MNIKFQNYVIGIFVILNSYCKIKKFESLV